MVQNPAYVVIDSYHQSRPEEATDGSFHQSTSPGTLCKDLVWRYPFKAYRIHTIAG